MMFIRNERAQQVFRRRRQNAIPTASNGRKLASNMPLDPASTFLRAAHVLPVREAMAVIHDASANHRQRDS
jgi:hypothetical protein